jgi:ketosteroid isomerase-like protein
MSSANIAQIQRLYAAFGRGDVAAIIAGLAPEVDWQSVGRKSDYPAFGPRIGATDVHEFFQLVADNEEFSDFSPREFFAADDKVFVLGSYALTMKKTGRPVACEWVHVFTLRDGKVTRWREHTDTAQFAEGYAAASAKTAVPRRFVDEVCNARKLAVADELFAADHRYNDPGSPWVGQGPAGIKDVIGVYHRGIKDARWDVHEITATGDTVVLRWSGSGTHTGELLGIAPTNRKVRVDGIWIFRVAGGKIIESWNCWDTLGMLQQLGVVPQLGAKAA